MQRYRPTPALLSITLIILSSLACQTVVRAISPKASAPEPAPNTGDATLSMDWLVSADELNSLSTEIGIVEWKLVKEFPGENRICRSFQGASWSATPNEGMNCIFKAVPGTSLDGVIKSMFSDGNFLEGEQPVNTTLLNLEGEYAVYAGAYPTGHSVFDLVLLTNDLVYWSSVTLGTPAGESAASIHQSAPELIDTFLVSVINKNLDKTR